MREIPGAEATTRGIRSSSDFQMCFHSPFFSDADDVSSVEEIDFVVDPVVTSGIEKAREIAKKFATDLNVTNVFFDKFGKVDLKKRRVRNLAFNVVFHKCGTISAFHFA